MRPRQRARGGEAQSRPWRSAGKGVCAIGLASLTLPLFLVLRLVLRSDPLSARAHGHPASFFSKAPSQSQSPLAGAVSNRTLSLPSAAASGGRAGSNTPNAAGSSDPRGRGKGRESGGAGQGLSACLVTKDDNAILTEWIAFHYHTLPLRHLIVLEDPSAKWPVERFLDPWRDLINITSVSARELRPVISFDSYRRHLSRQYSFYSKCLTMCKLRGERAHAALAGSASDGDGDKPSNWVVLIDTDEYMMLNPDSAPGNGTSWDASRPFPRTEIALRQPPFADRKCLVVPRLFFDAVEGEEEGGSEAGSAARRSPLPVARNLSTLRFFHHARKGEFPFNEWGKALVDVSRTSMAELAKVDNPHCPFWFCAEHPIGPGKFPSWVEYFPASVRVHHYLNTWELYSARRDKRRSRERFDKLSRVANGGFDYAISGWLADFVRVHGEEEAGRLLGGVGKMAMCSDDDRRHEQCDR